MNKYQEAQHNYEVMREVWNDLPGSQLFDPFEWKTCYHDEEDREPRAWKHIYICNKCGFWIRQMGRNDTAEAPDAT